MEMTMLFNVLADTSDMCTELTPIFTTIGRVVSFIKIIVPIILVVLGSIDLMKAVMASKDDEIKKAQSTLIKRVIYGVVIFFIPTIVGLVIGLVNGDKSNACYVCTVDPGNSACRELNK